MSPNPNAANAKPNAPVAAVLEAGALAVRVLRATGQTDLSRVPELPTRNSSKHQDCRSRPEPGASDLGPRTVRTVFSARQRSGGAGCGGPGTAGAGTPLSPTVHREAKHKTLFRTKANASASQTRYSTSRKAPSTWRERELPHHNTRTQPDAGAGRAPAPPAQGSRRKGLGPGTPCGRWRPRPGGDRRPQGKPGAPGSAPRGAAALPLSTSPGNPASPALTDGRPRRGRAGCGPRNPGPSCPCVKQPHPMK